MSAPRTCKRPDCDSTKVNAAKPYCDEHRPTRQTEPLFCIGGCGTQIPRRLNGGNPRKWASERHRVRAYYNGHCGEHAKICAFCNGPFEARNSKAMYCRPLCRSRKQGAERRLLPDALPRACEECGIVWTPSPRNYGARFHTQECAQNTYRAAYRARERAAFIELVAMAVLGDRDGWMCGLCEEPIDRNATGTAYDSPSRDHIFPLSMGGAHSYGNTQAAHRGCNQWKSNRVDITVAEFRAHREEFHRRRGTWDSTNSAHRPNSPS